jgi:hypothetical protein
VTAQTTLGEGVVARLRVSDADLAGPILERLVGALAARVDMPVDRLSDAQIVAAAVAAAAGRATPELPIRVDFSAQDGAVALRVGPLPDGAAARLVAESALPGVGRVLERLPDRWRVEPLGDGEERLELTIAADGVGSPPAR